MGLNWFKYETETMCVALFYKICLVGKEFFFFMEKTFVITTLLVVEFMSFKEPH